MVHRDTNNIIFSLLTMTENRSLHDYTTSMKRLKQECSNAGMSDEEFRELYFESLSSINEIDHENSTHQRLHEKYRIVFIVLTVLLAITTIYNFITIYSYLACNLQEYIYPGLRLLRRLSIPLLSLFPSLTELYHETCLIQNPFFTVVDMDCWPCSAINNVQEISEKLPNNQHVAPFVYETNQPDFGIETLKKMYLDNRQVFEKESPKILKDGKYHVNPDNMFHSVSLGDKSLHIWKFNTMNVARILRQIIPRPKIVPKFGQSTERFIIVDTSQSSFRAPDTECNYSFLLMLKGTRTVDLLPAVECKHQCKALKVKLKESYLLWYNWWYWRPVIQPSHGNDTMIAHVSSYC